MMPNARPARYGRTVLDPSPPSQTFVLSHYITILAMDAEWFFVSHAALGSRRVYHASGVQLLRQFETPRTIPDGVAQARELGIVAPPGAENDKQVDLFLMEARLSRLLVPAAEDEHTAVLTEVRRRYGTNPAHAMALGAMEDAFEPVLPQRIESTRPAGGKKVEFLLLGWCFTQSVRPLLQQEAAAAGLDAVVNVGFHDDLGLVAQFKPDVTVLQLSHRMVLAPLLDHLAATTAQQRVERLALAVATVERSIQAARDAVDGKLLLVQGIAVPQASPLGLLEYRDAPGMAAMIQAVNAAAAAACAGAPNVLFVDEDALLSRTGKRWLLDDLVSTLSHHGALAFDADDPGADDRLKSFNVKDRLLLHRVLARAYVDLYRAYRGEELIRLVCVDLDGTLWPGEAGSDGWTLQDDKVALSLMYGRHGGLHEALKALKERGILLAAVSKNTPEVVLRKWRMEDVPLVFRAEATDTRHYLVPEDCVRLKIGWGRKSDSIRELMNELGITANQVAFIDDHPVERAEVSQALPDVLVLGEDMNLVREALLTHPRFFTVSHSNEARERTHSTRARLLREDAQASAPDHAAFLRSLEVRCTVAVEDDVTRVPRLAELLARTNQFNTTALRLPAAELIQHIQHKTCRVLSMHVADRFADYGLVGVAVVEGSTISCVAMSCRVLGLEAEQVLLRKAMEVASQHGPVVTLRFTAAPEERNMPARRLLATPGFKPNGTNLDHVLDLREAQLPPLPGHVRVLG